MFARTERLLLRPGFPEDAPALASAIGDRAVARNLALVPFPYRLEDARAYLASEQDPLLPSLLVTERGASGAQIVGGCGLSRRHSGAVEIGFWVARSYWGRGIATESCIALLEMAKMLGLGFVDAFHFTDNSASARVLEKLGFEPTGILAPRLSPGRNGPAPARLMRLTLRASDVPEAIAA